MKTNLEIRFRPSGRPTQVNPVCAQCVAPCKQHKLVTLIYCPSFNPASRRSTQKSRHPSLAKNAETSPQGGGSAEVQSYVADRYKEPRNTLNAENINGHV